MTLSLTQLSQHAFVAADKVVTEAIIQGGDCHVIC